MQINPFAAIKEIWDTLTGNGTEILGGTALELGQTYNLSENVNNFKKVVVFYAHSATGNVYTINFYPALQTGRAFITLQSVYTASNINTAALKFENATVQCANCTSGTLPHILKIVGFKTY